MRVRLTTTFMALVLFLATVATVLSFVPTSSGHSNLEPRIEQLEAKVAALESKTLFILENPAEDGATRFKAPTHPCGFIIHAGGLAERVVMSTGAPCTGP